LELCKNDKPGDSIIAYLLVITIKQNAISINQNW
jgi:hypothetical protein